ncbi:MAG TPA: hypothetical protein VHD83_18740 [Puia sp.]|nr:hypothetical protein [Puia sp.]
MQKMWWTGALLFGLAGAGGFSGCKKSSDMKAVCRVVGIYNVQDSVNEGLTYDSHGRLSVLAAGSQIYTYDRSDNRTIITYYSAGLLISKTTVITNQAGLAVNVRLENTQIGVDWINDVNEYEDERIIRTTRTASDHRPAVITTYQWTDGNMTISITGSDTTHYSYYTDKPRQPGDYLSLAQLTTGYEIYRVKNLFKSQGDIDFVYSWGPDGKISAFKAMEGGSNIAGILLDHQCE